MLKKLLYLPVIILLGAWSWFLYNLGEGGEDGQALVKNGWGLFSPAMDTAWGRLFKPTDPNDKWSERVKNVGSEWMKTKGQRGYKASSFVYVLTLIVATVAITVVAVV